MPSVKHVLGQKMRGIALMLNKKVGMLGTDLHFQGDSDATYPGGYSNKVVIIGSLTHLFRIY